MRECLQKSLWKTGSCRRGTFWWPFPVFEILAYCSLYFRFPCRALFYSVPWNQNESVYISQTETNITKEFHTTLEQISIMNLKRENASDQVEVRFGFTSNFCRGWCAISDYCWNPLDHCSFKLPHVINLFRQLISSVFFSRLMNSWPPRTTAQRRILWRWNRLLWASLQLLTRPCVDQSERLLRPEAMTLHVMFWHVLVGPVASMLAPLHGPSECHLCSFTGEEETTTFRNSCKKRKALVILRLNRLFGPWALSIEYRKLFWIAILLLHWSFLFVLVKL